MSKFKLLLMAACVAMSAAAIGQDSAVSPDTAVTAVPVPAQPGNVVEGATADRVARIEACQGNKFESVIEIDAVSKRSTRVKLCADPGATNADWVKTLEAAMAQIEQRDMPPAAKNKLIAELKAEMTKFASVSTAGSVSTFAPKSVAAEGVTLFAPGDTTARSALIEPTERFETTTLPPLVAPKRTAAGMVVPSKPQPPMNIRVKCLERGQSGAGGTCDFFQPGTILAISAVVGLEQGGILRFQRRGDPRAEVRLSPMQAGQMVRIKLPTELCKGVSYSKVEIELLRPSATGAVAARFGPYGLRC